ncbi:large ribosomal subunit protein uL1m isoform X2 [Anolis carolinensis]|uniref:large ribosomal subunit protein uL1m isoform X2 n=1 Tax=Anolis carolinensis TaxID=28377 RepID=UPI000462B4B2|nr:PREDICTED: 39S ribosomal protein L1, mitochondrial isoform X2 [Anolis carolinensis]|eukprot:XP_008110343.1 PREDICTED: 39S ribosomal protein L1, mitochondrial isoform X2 [Anolis carolinensis]
MWPVRKDTKTYMPLLEILAQRPVFSRNDQHSTVLPCFANSLISHRHYAAKPAKKTKSDPQKKPQETESKQKKKRLSFPLLKEPTDDVYLTWCYERPVYDAEVAVDMLKKFQQLDFTSPNQPVHADITLDLAMDKKKTVEPFVNTVLLPYRFTEEINKVLVFTDKAEDVKTARENGAAFVGGAELIKPIFDGEIQADYYVSVPTIASKILPLRATLKKKFPRTKNGSISYDVAEMVGFFKLCHEYSLLENDDFIHTTIATLDMPNEQIVANLDAVIKDVCKYKPLSYGPFVTRLIIRSSSSEGLDLKFERFLPEGVVKEKVKKVEKEEEKGEEKEEDSDDEGEVQKSR